MFCEVNVKGQTLALKDQPFLPICSATVCIGKSTDGCDQAFPVNFLTSKKEET